MTTLSSMKAVGVKQLKARLSEYLRMVRRGEILVVTDLDEVVAELRPAGSRPAPGETVEEALGEVEILTADARLAEAAQAV